MSNTDCCRLVLPPPLGSLNRTLLASTRLLRALGGATSSLLARGTCHFSARLPSPTCLSFFNSPTTSCVLIVAMSQPREKQPAATGSLELLSTGVNSINSKKQGVKLGKRGREGSGWAFGSCMRQAAAVEADSRRCRSCTITGSTQQCRRTREEMERVTQS